MTNVVERLLEWGSTPAAPDNDVRLNRESGPNPPASPPKPRDADEPIDDRDRRESR